MGKIKISISIIFFCWLLMTCDSTRNIYRSSISKEDYWTVNAFTLSHCGCTQLFVENYANGRHDFQIMYTDDFARKNIFRYDDRGKLADTVVLIARKDDFKIRFDSLDNEIFKRINQIANNKEGLVYGLKWTEYNGFTAKEQ